MIRIVIHLVNDDRSTQVGRRRPKNPCGTLELNRTCYFVRVILTVVFTPGYNTRRSHSNAVAAMNNPSTARCTAFAGSRRLESGTLADVVLAVKAALDRGEQAPVLIFDDVTSRVVDVDLRGTDAEIVARLGLSDTMATTGETVDDAGDASPYRESLTPRGRGRPKLGVVAREVTLLPRHWNWLSTQPGGASAAVRRLVDAARQANVEKDRIREAQESAYRFMSAMAGNEPGFEEATRALFAGDEAMLQEMTKRWPADVREYAWARAGRAFGSA